jgi:hypothetical protein
MVLLFHCVPWGAVCHEERSFFWIPWICEQQSQLLVTDCQIWGTIYFIPSKHVLKKYSTRIILHTGSDTHVHEDENVSLVSNGSDTDKERDNIAYGLHTVDWLYTVLTICIL